MDKFDVSIKFAKYAYAGIETKYIDAEGNLSIPTGSDVIVDNWGWLWADEYSEKYWGKVLEKTEGTRVLEFCGEERIIERFETAPGMVYYIPGNGNNHIVSGITKEDYEDCGYLRIHVYYAGEDFDEAQRVYDSMNKDEFYMLDLLSYDAHFAVRSTRRKTYA